MAKLFDPRECATAKLITININLDPIGSGNPTTWRAQASMGFMCYDTEGNVLGLVQSGGSRIPYFIFLDGEKEKPTLKEILQAWHITKAKRDAWIKDQVLALSEEILDI